MNEKIEKLMESGCEKSTAIKLAWGRMDKQEKNLLEIEELLGALKEIRSNTPEYAEALRILAAKCRKGNLQDCLKILKEEWEDEIILRGTAAGARIWAATIRKTREEARFNDARTIWCYALQYRRSLCPKAKQLMMQKAQNTEDWLWLWERTPESEEKDAIWEKIKNSLRFFWDGEKVFGKAPRSKRDEIIALLLNKAKNLRESAWVWRMSYATAHREKAWKQLKTIAKTPADWVWVLFDIPSDSVNRDPVWKEIMANINNTWPSDQLQKLFWLTQNSKGVPSDHRSDYRQQIWRLLKENASTPGEWKWIAKETRNCSERETAMKEMEKAASKILSE